MDIDGNTSQHPKKSKKKKTFLIKERNEMGRLASTTASSSKNQSEPPENMINAEMQEKNYKM